MKANPCLTNIKVNLKMKLILIHSFFSSKNKMIKLIIQKNSNLRKFKNGFDILIFFMLQMNLIEKKCKCTCLKYYACILKLNSSSKNLLHDTKKDL